MAFQSPFNPLAFLAQYDEGRAVGRQNKLARLAEDTRATQGRALRGEAGAMDELAGLDSDAYMNTQNFVDNKKKAETAEFLGSIYNAKDKATFDAVVSRFKARGHQFDPGEDDFANRDSLLRSGMTVAQQMGIDMQKAAAEAAAAQASEASAYRRDVLSETSRHNQAMESNAAARNSVAASAAAAKNAPKPLSASMLKLKRETETNIGNITNTLAGLREAKALLPDVHQGNYTLPETRAAIGNTLPDKYVPDSVATPKSSQATANYNKIMRSEAIQNMSATLKGATTDKEMREFIDLIADPAAPRSVKEAAIDRMIRKAETTMALEQDRLKEFGDTMPPGSEIDTLGGSDNADDQPSEDAVLQQAQEAIDAGADPQEVLDRLRGIAGYEDIELQGPEEE